MATTVREMLDSVCGKNEETGLPNAASSLTTGIFIESSEETTEIASFSTLKPVVNIERHQQFVVCDFTFSSAYDEDLKQMFKIFELYGKNSGENSISDYGDGQARVPYLALVLTAVVGPAHMFTLISPVMWVLTSAKPGSMPNTLRVLFTIENVLMQEGQEEEILAHVVLAAEEAQKTEIPDREIDHGALQ